MKRIKLLASCLVLATVLFAGSYSAKAQVGWECDCNFGGWGIWIVLPDRCECWHTECDIPIIE